MTAARCELVALVKNNSLKRTDVQVVSKITVGKKEGPWGLRDSMSGRAVVLRTINWCLISSTPYGALFHFEA